MMYEGESLFHRIFMGCVLLFYACVLIWIGWMLFEEEYAAKRRRKK